MIKSDIDRPAPCAEAVYGRRISARGFTLVELLVVMAIVGVLMGMIFPAIKLVQQRARLVELSKVISEVSAACRMYKSDKAAYPWGPTVANYDPDAATYTTAQGTFPIAPPADIIRILAPDEPKLRKGNVSVNTKSYISIPKKQINVPRGGVDGDQTLIDIWEQELKYITDPASLDPVVWSIGPNSEDFNVAQARLLSPAGADETKDDFMWSDPNGDLRYDPTEQQGDGDYGDDIGPQQ